MPAYPNNIKNFTTKLNNVDLYDASHINDLQDEVMAIETELGTLPKGSHASVKARMEAHEGATTAHSAVSTATANRIIVRDANARAQVADGVASADICTKGQLDAAIANVAARIVYVQDDTEVSVSGTTETTRKSFKLVKHSTSGINVKNIWFAAELRVSAGTGTIRLYRDTTLLLSAQTTSTSYVLVVAGPFDASGWANGIYEFTVRLLNSGSNTTHNRFFELYVS